MITTNQMDTHAANSLFKMLDHDSKQHIEAYTFLEQLSRTGILSDDP